MPTTTDPTTADFAALLRRGPSTPDARRPTPTATPAARPYEDWTRDELYERAKDLGIPGRGEMTKEQLVAALRPA